jgi:cell wall-associated NlpC family hydrolase
MGPNDVMKLIGAPYKPGEKGPTYFDCWGLTVHVEWTYFGRWIEWFPHTELSLRSRVEAMRQIDVRRTAAGWKIVDKPRHGSIVLMSHANYPHHSGVFLELDGGGVLHTEEKFGVVFDPIWNLRCSGWLRFIYNDPA